MGGWPVWLASASLHDKTGRTRPAKDWDAPTTARVSETISVLLDGVGDEEHEREFRMCVTLCRHRALTDAEFEALPGWWHEADAVDIAGGPVEVLWSRNVPSTPGTEPCVNPGKERLPGGRLWLPVDCGACAPCQARAEVRDLRAADIRRPW